METQTRLGLIRQVPQGGDESDLLEHSSALTFGFVIGMLFTCIIGFGLLGIPVLILSAIRSLSEKWKSKF